MKFDLATLRKFRLFEQLNDRELESLLEIAEEAVYEKGQWIFHESSLAVSFYLILEGKIEIKMTGGVVDEPMTMEMVGAGQGFGWSAIAQPHTFTASALAVEKTRLIMFNGDLLRDLFKKNNYIGYCIMVEISGMISRRLRRCQVAFLRQHQEHLIRS